jgi:hypothetical protein
MPGGGSLSAAFATTTTSKVLVQAGVTAMPAALDLSALVPSVSALVGWEINETTGSASAHVKLYDGTSASGIEVADVEIPEGVTNNSPGDFEPVQVFNGAVYLQVVSGSVAGAVFYAL